MSDYMIIDVEEITKDEYERIRLSAGRRKLICHSGPDHFVTQNPDRQDDLTLYQIRNRKHYVGSMRLYPLTNMHNMRIARVVTRTQLIFEAMEPVKPGDRLPDGGTPADNVKRMKRAS
jgi:hypothetical protein